MHPNSHRSIHVVIAVALKKNPILPQMKLEYIIYVEEGRKT
jgi:hypothetical protein